MKPISREGVEEAIRKAERYRLLNEPWQAESICRDVLQVEPANPTAIVMLLLSLTDQFSDGADPGEARRQLANLEGAYERAYYGGIVSERYGHALLKQSSPGAAFHAYEAFREAMRLYEEAERQRPAGNDDAILRWNTCARVLMRNATLQPGPVEVVEPITSE
ncbi:MAG: hypothetical protein KIT09_36000 [Bryobacteraceae bacterium]|nr:hypothetical protein [Bryobacteraceae bacterium]